jgi:acyl carrier protein
MNTTYQEVIQIVSIITKASQSSILPQTDLRKDLNVDSLQGLQIVAAIEKHFDIQIPDDELDNYATINEIVATIDRVRQRSA